MLRTKDRAQRRSWISSPSSSNLQPDTKKATLYQDINSPTKKEQISAWLFVGVGRVKEKKKRRGEWREGEGDKVGRRQKKRGIEKVDRRVQGAGRGRG